LNSAATINIKLGLYYLQQKNLPQAKAKLLLALVQAPQNFLVYDAMGYFLETIGEIVAAEKYYSYAVVIAVKQQVGSKKGAAMLARGESDNNFGVNSFGINSIGAAYNNYGTFLYRQGRCREALSQFSLAINEYDYLNSVPVRANARFATLCLNNREDVRREKYSRKNT